MFVDVAATRVAKAMRRVGMMLLEDFGMRPAEVAAPAEVLVPEGVVWTGRARRSADLQRFVDHLTATQSR
jgi:hypothetical protein